MSTCVCTILINSNKNDSTTSRTLCSINQYPYRRNRRAFGQHHTNAFKFTDSQIVLHWISNENQLLKQWVCNRIIEIKRFTDPDQWRYTHTSNTIADLGTRRGTTLEDINSSSQWINGLSWMTKEVENFPMKTVRELSLSSDKVNQIKEQIPSNKEFSGISTNQQVHSASIHHKGNVPEEVTSRYRLSNYILDPNKFHFSKVIRIVALVIKQIQKLIKLAENQKG